MAATPEETRAAGRAYREANKERIQEVRRAYREANKEYIAAKNAADAKTEHGRVLRRAREQRYRAAYPERVRLALAKTKAKRAPVAREEARTKRLLLKTSYVAQMLRLPTAVAPPELIEAERMRLKIKREIQELDKYRTEKKCSTCKTYRPILSFSRSRLTKDGHANECKFCSRERNQKERHAKGLTYVPKQVDEFGQFVKMTAEQRKAKVNAYARAKYAIDKQRNQHEQHQ